MKIKLFVAALLLSIFNCTAQYTKLMDFDSINGLNPRGDLFFDGSFFYGMAPGGANNKGTIFKIKPDGTGYFKLFDFAGVNGEGSVGSLISDGTFLYGMTGNGGISTNCSTLGCGTIFKIRPDGSGFSKLLDFTGAANGSYPRGSFLLEGNFLYGMTLAGGINGKGTIFKLKLDGTGYVKLLDFNGLNGNTPWGNLISDGNFLYGMTSGGGSNNYGTIFKIKPDGSGYTLLYDFAGVTNGSNPHGSLIYDGTFLYGMAMYNNINNYGTIFKIKPDGTGCSTLLDFSGVPDGAYPSGSLVYDGTFLYGMTWQGGTSNTGIIFKIKPDGSGYTNLYDFNDTNGNYPCGSFLIEGNFLYGMVKNGGTNNYGTVFKYGIVTGITENDLASAINISPNPFNQQTVISFSQEQKNINVKITDVLGKEIKTINFTGKELIIEKEEMQSGIYFLQIKTDRSIVSKKLIINK